MTYGRHIRKGPLAKGQSSTKQAHKMDSFAPPRVEFNIPLLLTSLSNTTLPKSHRNLPLIPGGFWDVVF